MHTIELHAVSIPPTVVPPRSVETNYLNFSRVRKTLSGFWTMKLTLSTLTDSVPADRMEEYNDSVREIREDSVWSVLVPTGDPRPHQRPDFAALPDSWDSDFVMPTPPQPRLLLGKQPEPKTSNGQPKSEIKSDEAAAVSTGSKETTGETKTKRRKRIKRRRDPESTPKMPIVIAAVLGLILILIVVLVAKNADRWHIFRVRPAQPVPGDTGS
jgi:hypothetical protein